MADTRVNWEERAWVGFIVVGLVLICLACSAGASLVVSLLVEGY